MFFSSTTTTTFLLFSLHHHHHHHHISIVFPPPPPPPHFYCFPSTTTATTFLLLSLLTNKSKRPILVGAVHRPPSRTAAIDTALELNIEAAYLRKQEMYLLGDLNINYLDTATYQNHRLIRALKSLSLSQVISSVTRPMSSTCLDHLYTTHQSFIADISVPNFGMSGHFPILFWRKYTRNKCDGTNKLIEYRDYKNLNKDNLQRDLDNASWDTAFESKCVYKILDSLENMLNAILNRHIPLKTRRVKRQNQPAWMTTDVHESIKTRDKLLRRARKTNKKKDWNHYSNAKF